MALVWADGFDHYGANSTFLAQNGYSASNVLWLTGAGNTRTGLACLRFDPTNKRMLRRPMNASSRLVQGAGMRVWQTSATLNRANGFRGESTAGTQEYKVVPNTQLGLSVIDRTGAVVGNSPNAIYNMNSWNWVEVQADKNSAGVNTGRIEVRLEGQMAVTVNGVNLPNDFQNHCLGADESVDFGQVAGVDFDDYTVCDISGVRNNSFIGDRRCDTSVTSADTALADWALVGGANGWGILDNIPPDDTKYIEALLAGNISEFQHTPLTVQTNDVAAVIGFARLTKSDAGAAGVRMGINSNANVSNGPSISPGTAFNYFNQIWELDPNGNIPWVRAAVNAAMLRLTRDV